MKNLFLIMLMAMMLQFGVVVSSFAGEHPSEHPSGSAEHPSEDPGSADETVSDEEEGSQGRKGKASKGSSEHPH